MLPVAGDRIPDEVWDEVDAAAALFEQLHEEGRRMVFDHQRLTGRVVVSLVDDHTGAATPLSLRQAVDPHSVS